MTAPGDREQALDLADQAIAVGDWNTVIQLTDGILAVDPDDDDARALHRLATRQLAKRLQTDDSERRFLTVVFVDLVGSTVISEALDPEDFASLLERYQAIAEQAITEFGGRIVKLLGDGVMAQFGYPKALEDGPRLACLAGLRIGADLAERRAELEKRFGVEVECRVGIHSGTAVVSGGDVLGEVPNTAAHLEGAAPPGGVAVSESTRSLTEGLFEFRQVDTEDLIAFQVLRPIHESDAVRRVVVERELIGRRAELDRLESAWSDARAGRGGVLQLVGPAGIGKSRLLKEFAATIEGTSGAWVEGGAAEFRGGRPFHLFNDAVDRWLAAHHVDPADPEAVGAHLGVDGSDARLLTAAGMMGDELTPAQVRRSVFRSMVGWLDRLSERRPVVMALEDLHWADPSSLELLGVLAEEVTKRPVLILATSRSDTAAELGADVITLEPLSQEESRRMASTLGADLGLTADDVFALTERSGGVPLFVEQLVRSLESSDADALPESLRDLLAARLDSFGPAKRAAQLGSIFGRSFSTDLVRELDPEGTHLQSWVEELVTGGMLEPVAPDSHTFRFGHSLMQDAAYESLLRSERRRLHARAAAALEQLRPDSTASAPDVLAHHLTEAGETALAFGEWMNAGALAARTAAREAVSHYERAAQLLGDLPDELREEAEYRLRIAQSAPLTAVYGYAAPEVEEVYVRAAQLGAAGDDPTRRFAATRGLASTRLLRAEIAAAADLGAEALRVAEESGDGELLMEAESWLGTALFFTGDLVAASRHLDACRDLYDTVQHRQHGYRFGIDPLVLADSHRSWSLELTGRSEDGLELALGTLEHARTISHKLSEAHALNYLAGLHQMRGELEDQRRVASEEVALAIELGLVHYIHYGRILSAHAETHLGDEEAVERMISALDDRLATGAQLARPYHLSLIADGHEAIGDHDAAATALDEAIAVASRTGEKWWLGRIDLARAELAPTTP